MRALIDTQDIHTGTTDNRGRLQIGKNHINKINRFVIAEDTKISSELNTDEVIVKYDSEDVDSKKTDKNGRVTIGTSHADQQVMILVLETK
jgi:hypothetical protein